MLALTASIGLACAGSEPADAAVATASQAAPMVTTGPATGIGLDGATLQGSVNPGELQTTYYFEYGPTAAYGTQTQAGGAGPTTADVPVSATLAGLNPGTVYHYRLVAANALGTAFGADETFRTFDAALRGTFRTRVHIVSGGQVFGQRAGRTKTRLYRFRSRCRNGYCTRVALRRRGASGVFRSRLTPAGDGSYAGTERFSGRCDDGERFSSTARLTIRPTALSSAGVSFFEGRLSISVHGCVSGGEEATLAGKRVGRRHR